MRNGCGATHFVVALANYFRSALGRKTAVIELSAQGDLESLVKREADQKQELFGVHYYTGVCMGRIPDILNGDGEVFIMDLGTDFRTVREEFLRCDRKIVLGSLSLWQIASYEQYFSHIIAGEQYKEWKFLALSADRRSRKAMQKKYGIYMKAVPYMENPFLLKKEDIKFLQRIL